MSTHDGRGYFKRVGRVVAWFIMVIMAIIGLFQIISLLFQAAMNDSRVLSWKFAERGLHRCDCNDCSSHVDPEFHSANCSYRKWYEQEVDKIKRKETKE